MYSGVPFSIRWQFLRSSRWSCNGFPSRSMPMGLKNACATFQRLMDHVLGDLIGVACYVHMDDIIVFSQDIEEHRKRVYRIVERSKAFELKIKSKKCEFLKEEIRILGHQISYNSIRQAESKVQAIATAEPPRTVKNLRFFLGLANYYRKFIRV